MAVGQFDYLFGNTSSDQQDQPMQSSQPGQFDYLFNYNQQPDMPMQQPEQQPPMEGTGAFDYLWSGEQPQQPQPEQMAPQPAAPEQTVATPPTPPMPEQPAMQKSPEVVPFEGLDRGFDMVNRFAKMFAEIWPTFNEATAANAEFGIYEAAKKGDIGRVLTDMGAVPNLADRMTDTTDQFPARSVDKKAVDDYLERNAKELGTSPKSLSKEILKSVQENPVRDVLRSKSFQDARAFRDRMDTMFPTMEKYDETHLAQLASGMGSMASIALATAAGGVVGGAAVGGQMNQMQVFRDALMSGADFEEAMNTSRIGNVLGWSEVVPIERAFGRFDDLTGGYFSKLLRGKLAGVKGKIAKDAFETMVAEAVQEGGLQVADNALAKFTYDTKRDLMKDVAPQTAVGGELGFLFGALGSRFRNRFALKQEKAFREYEKQLTADLGNQPGLPLDVPEGQQALKERPAAASNLTEDFFQAKQRNPDLSWDEFLMNQESEVVPEDQQVQDDFDREVEDVRTNGVVDSPRTVDVINPDGSRTPITITLKENAKGVRRVVIHRDGKPVARKDISGLPIETRSQQQDLFGGVEPDEVTTPDKLDVQLDKLKGEGQGTLTLRITNLGKTEKRSDIITIGFNEDGELGMVDENGQVHIYGPGSPLPLVERLRRAMGGKPDLKAREQGPSIDINELEKPTPEPTKPEAKKPEPTKAKEDNPMERLRNKQRGKTSNPSSDKVVVSDNGLPVERQLEDIANRFGYNTESNDLLGETPQRLSAKLKKVIKDTAATWKELPRRWGVMDKVERSADRDGYIIAEALVNDYEQLETKWGDKVDIDGRVAFESFYNYFDDGWKPIVAYRDYDATGGSASERHLPKLQYRNDAEFAGYLMEKNGKFKALYMMPSNTPGKYTLEWTDGAIAQEIGKDYVTDAHVPDGARIDPTIRGQLMRMGPEIHSGWSQYILRPSPSSVVAIPPPTRLHASITKFMREAFGRDIIWLQSTDTAGEAIMQRLGGFVNRAAPDQLYVGTRGSTGRSEILKVVFHELLHSIKGLDGRAYIDFTKGIAEVLTDYEISRQGTHKKPLADFANDPARVDDPRLKEALGKLDTHKASDPEAITAIKSIMAFGLREMAHRGEWTEVALAAEIFKMNFANGTDADVMNAFMGDTGVEEFFANTLANVAGDSRFWVNAATVSKYRTGFKKVLDKFIDMLNQMTEWFTIRAYKLNKPLDQRKNTDTKDMLGEYVAAYMLNVMKADPKYSQMLYDNTARLFVAIGNNNHRAGERAAADLATQTQVNNNSYIPTAQEQQVLNSIQQRPTIAQIIDDIEQHNKRENERLKQAFENEGKKRGATKIYGAITDVIGSRAINVGDPVIYTKRNGEVVFVDGTPIITPERWANTKRAKFGQITGLTWIGETLLKSAHKPGAKAIKGIVNVVTRNSRGAHVRIKELAKGINTQYLLATGEDMVTADRETKRVFNDYLHGNITLDEARALHPVSEAFWLRLQQARADIATLSRIMVQEGMVPAEVRASIIDNIGLYAHVQYAINDLKRDGGMDADKLMRSVPPEVRNAFLEAVHHAYVNPVITDGGRAMASMSYQTLTRMVELFHLTDNTDLYDRKTGEQHSTVTLKGTTLPLRQAKKADLIKALKAANLENIDLDLLMLEFFQGVTANSTSPRRPHGREKSIEKKRVLSRTAQQLADAGYTPAEIEVFKTTRELLLEVVDPITTLGQTINLMAGTIQSHRILNNMAMLEGLEIVAVGRPDPARGLTTKLVPDNSSWASVKIRNPENPSKWIDASELYVNGDTRRMFEQMVNPKVFNSKWLDAAKFAAGFAKVNLTAYNPRSHPRNFVSANLIALNRGHWVAEPKAVGRAIAVASQLGAHELGEGVVGAARSIQSKLGYKGSENVANNEQIGRVIEYLTQLGILHDSARTGPLHDLIARALASNDFHGELSGSSYMDWRGRPMEALTEELSKRIGKHAKSKIMRDMSRIGLDAAKAAIDVPMAAFRLEDEAMKMFAWTIERERRAWIEGRDDVVEAMRGNGTIDDAMRAKIKEYDRAAAEHIRNVYPTYSKVPAFLQSLSRNIFFTPFPSFNAEMIRNSWFDIQDLAYLYNASVGKGGHRNPYNNAVPKRAAAVLAGRFGATTAYGALLATITSSFNLLWQGTLATTTIPGIGEMDDKEEERKRAEKLNSVLGKDTAPNKVWGLIPNYDAIDRPLRTLLASYDADSLYMIVGYKPGDRARIVNVEYTLPGSQMANAAVNTVAAANALAHGNVERAFDIAWASVIRFVSDYAQTDVVTKAVEEALSGTTSTGSRVWTTRDTDEERHRKQIEHVLQLLIPGGSILREWDKIAQANEEGRLAAELAEFPLGINAKDIDFKDRMVSRAAQIINKQINPATSALYAYASTPEHIPDDDFERYYRKLESYRRDQVEELGDIYRNVNALGVDEGDMFQHLRLHKMRTTADMSATRIYNGGYKPLKIGISEIRDRLNPDIKMDLMDELGDEFERRVEIINMIREEMME